jgi:two-component system sensor histidine kinase KdpD
MTITEGELRGTTTGGLGDRARTAATSKDAAPAAAIGLVAACTLVVAIATPTVPADAAGVIYLLGVLGVSSIYGLWWGLATSLASAAAFNFFFLPPAHTFVIKSSSDWAALCVFALTAVVASNLASRARRERDEAARRAEEAQLSEAFATLLANAPSVAAVLPALAEQAGRALGAEDAAIIRGAHHSPPRRASVLPLELNGRWMGELWLYDAPEDALDSPAARRIARGLAGLIALGEERDHRVEQQVRAEALLQSDELKTALLRTVSHDLRSPLMAITTAAGGLRYAELDADDRELLDTITGQSARMSRLIENLLELSKLQAGTRPHAVWLDPRELIESSVDALPQAPGERLETAFERDLPLVQGDAAQLQRVVVNLLDNALKFSPSDSPVRMSVRRGADAVVVEVADRGPGIPGHEIERIFEPFHRGAGVGTEGNGLGLAIARGLADANGCEVSVAATSGAGTTFALRLPVPPER